MQYFRGGGNWCELNWLGRCNSKRGWMQQIEMMRYSIRNITCGMRQCCLQLIVKKTNDDMWCEMLLLDIMILNKALVHTLQSATMPWASFSVITLFRCSFYQFLYFEGDCLSIEVNNIFGAGRINWIVQENT